MPSGTPIVHGVIGIAGLAAAVSLARSPMFCQVFGIMLLALGVVGIVVSNPFGLVPIGGVDIALHLVTGAILSYFGFAAAGARSPAVA